MIISHLVVTILIASFFSNLFILTPDEKSKKHYAKAIEHIENNEDPAAIAELGNAIQIDGEFADAWYQLGLLHLNANVSKAALRKLQRAVSLDPINLDAKLKISSLYLFFNHKEKSQKYITQLLSIDPNYPGALALLAKLERLEGNFKNAEEIINKAIKFNRINGEFYNTKGYILIGQERWQEAEESFREALALDPTSLINHQALLLFYHHLQNETALQELLSRTKAKFSDNPRLYTILADLHRRRQEWKQAEEALLQYITSKEEPIFSRLRLANFYIGQQLYEKAEQTLKSSLTYSPNSIGPQLALAELLFDLDKFDEAHTIMTEILTRYPENGRATLLKARFLIRKKKESEAGTIINHLIDKFPNWSSPLYYSAHNYLTMGKVKLAQKDIEMAIQKDQLDDQFYILAAKIYLTKKNMPAAIEAASLAFNINPNNFIATGLLSQFIKAKEYKNTIQFIKGLNQDLVENNVMLLTHLGIAYFNTNGQDLAQRTFTRALKLDPDNSETLAFFVSLTAQQDFGKAISLIKEHITKNKESAGHLLLLSKFFIQNKQINEALQACTRAQELDATTQGYLLNAHLLKLLARNNEAIIQYQNLLQFQPKSIAALMGLAGIYEEQNQLDDAKKKYRQILELQPNLHIATNNLIWILVERNDGLDEALQLALQAKQSLPNQPQLIDTLGWVYYKRQAYPLAIAEFRTALKKRPHDTTILIHLALALYANNEKRAGIDSLKKALANNDNFKDRKEAQAILKIWQAKQ